MADEYEYNPPLRLGHLRIFKEQADQTYATQEEIANGYVAKEEGKGLSQEDFTSELKSKLEGLGEGTEPTVSGGATFSSLIADKPTSYAALGDMTQYDLLIVIPCVYACTVDDDDSYVPAGSNAVTVYPGAAVVIPLFGDASLLDGLQGKWYPLGGGTSYYAWVNSGFASMREEQAQAFENSFFTIDCAAGAGTLRTWKMGKILNDSTIAAWYGGGYIELQPKVYDVIGIKL
jgi:hypothetical protein